MRRVDILKRAARNLRQSKGRTFLTSLAIAVGAFTLTMALAAGQGARDYADKLISSNVDPMSIFVAKDPSLFGGGAGTTSGFKEYDENNTQFGGATFKSLDSSDLDLVRSTDGVESVTPMYLVTAKYAAFETSGKKYIADVTAYDPSVRAEVAAGSLPVRGEQLAAGDIIVPESFIALMGKKPAEVIGTTVTLHVEKAIVTPSEQEIKQALVSGEPSAIEALTRTESKDAVFRIAAVSAKSSTSFSASSALFISENDARELSEYITKGTSQYQKYITATVKVKDGYDPKAVKASFKDAYQKAGNKDYIIAKTASDLQELLFTIVNILQGIVVFFGILALLASVFGIINTQYISVLERTSQIGLMKALGMSRKAIAKLFRYEAAWIGFIGGVLGSVLAIALGVAINPLLTKQLSLGDGNQLLVFVWWQIVALVALLVVIAIAAGWFPARKAARLDPIEALRTE